MSHGDGSLDGLRRWLPSQDYTYSLVTGAVTFLLALGVVDQVQAALWTQLAIGVVTLVFAVVASPSMARSSVYALTGPLGAVLMAYGIVNDARWAVITAGVGQVLGLTTAAVASGRTAHGAVPDAAGLMTPPPVPTVRS